LQGESECYYLIALFRKKCAKNIKNIKMQKNAQKNPILFPDFIGFFCALFSKKCKKCKNIGIL
jgi:hypothetical protein